MAINNITIPATDSQIHYLKRLAALQFPGSIDNYGPGIPIHILQQQLPKEDTVKLDDAVTEGEDIEYSNFYYDEDGCGYSSVSEFVEVQLGLDDEDSIREYNEENPDLPYIPYEKLLEMDRKDIPEMLLSVVDEADYVDAYKEVTNIASHSVEVVPMSDRYESLGYAFTHQALSDVKESMSNHIFYPCRTYADCGEGFGRKAGDFYPLINFMYSAGEQLLVDDAKDIEILEKGRMTDDEVEAYYKEHPHEETIAIDFDIFKYGTNKFIKNIKVYIAGYSGKISMGAYPVCEKRYVVATDATGKKHKYSYPFSCDWGITSLNKMMDKNSKLSAAQQLYFWTEYKNSND